MDASLSALKKVISKSKFVDKRKHAEVIQRMDLLLTGELSSKSYKELVHGLRHSLVPVYTAYTLPALRFASSIFHTTYHERILAALSEQSLEEKKRWEDVLNSLLSGILDFLDDTTPDKRKHTAAKDALATALYPTLCDICFSLTAPMQPVDLRCTAYTLLSDTAVLHPANQQKLRDKTVLGGERLGNMIWRTKDYLALEALLTLFARLLPSSKDSHSNKSKRTAYIQSVFLSPQHSEHTSVGQSIAKLLEQEPSREWEETSQRIVEALATASLTFPQPFTVNEVKACEETKRCDKLYVDDKSLLVNVLVGEDQCEALEIPYTTMRKIEVVQKQARGSVVTIRVTTPPVASKMPVKSSSGQPLRAGFALASADVERFYAATRGRGLGKLFNDTPPKLSLAKSPARLEFDDQGQPLKELSQSERIENVEKFYHTNQQSSDDVSVESLSKALEAPTNAPSVSNARPSSAPLATKSKTRSPEPGAKSSPEQNSRVTEAHRPRNEEDVETPPTTLDVAAVPAGKVARGTHATNNSATRKARLVAEKPVKTLGRTRSAQIREEVFGASDEELSEVGDADDAPPVSRAKSVTKDPKLPDSTMTTESPAEERKLPSSTKARRMLVSDDEETGKRGSVHTGTARIQPARNKKKRAVPMTPDLSDEDVPEPLEKSFVTPPRSQLNSAVAPVTPTKPPAGRAPTMQEPSSPALGIPDVMYLDAQTSLPKNTERSLSHSLATMTERAPEAAVAATSVYASRSGPRKANQKSSGTAKQDDEACAKPSESTPHTRKDTGDTRTLRAEPKPATKTKPAPIDLELSDHVINSSSPVPVAKPGNSSVKARLRKKDQTLASDKAAAHVKSSKRKRDVVDDVEVDNENTEPPPKKARAEDPIPRQLRSRRTDSRVLRPANTAARPTQKYRTKQRKSSSPAAKTDVVDYDELPNSTTSDARVPSSPTSAQLARRGKKEDVKRKTELPARPTRRVAGAARSKKAEKTRDDPPSPVGLALRTEENGLPSANVGARDIEDEEEVTLLLTKPSKPSVIVVHTPIVEAMKVSAASTASKMNPFVEPAITSVTKSKGPENVGKSDEVKAKKSNKMPWMAATTPAKEDDGEDLSKKAPRDKIPEPEAATKTVKRKTTRTEAERGESLHYALEQEKPGTTFEEAFSTPHVATIDLTADDSPVKLQKASSPVFAQQSSLLHQLELDDTLVEPPRFTTSTPLHKPRAPSANGSVVKSARCVKFAPDVEEKLSSPTPLARSSLATSEALTKQVKAAKTHDRPGIEKTTKLPTKLGDKQAKPANSPATKRMPSRKDAVMDDIVEVLGELQQAILCRITQKFEGIKEEVRFGRNTLLSEAYEDLLQMRNENVVHFNRLIDLEAEYAKQGRLLSNGYEQLVREGKDVCSGLGRMLSDHDRGSLIKRMPVQLTALPACLRGETEA